MLPIPFPQTQGALLRAARAGATQTEFARFLGVDRSCLSRYESEALGAPTSVINACLRKVALQLAGQRDEPSAAQRALLLARELLDALENASRQGNVDAVERAPGAFSEGLA